MYLGSLLFISISIGTPMSFNTFVGPRFNSLNNPFYHNCKNSLLLSRSAQTYESMRCSCNERERTICYCKKKIKTKHIDVIFSRGDSLPVNPTETLVTQANIIGKQSPWGSLIANLKEMYEARHSWQAAF